MLPTNVVVSVAGLDEVVRVAACIIALADLPVVLLRRGRDPWHRGLRVGVPCSAIVVERVERRQGLHERRSRLLDLDGDAERRRSPEPPNERVYPPFVVAGDHGYPLREALAPEFGDVAGVPDGLELRTDHGPQFTGADCAAFCAAFCAAWDLDHTLAPNWPTDAEHRR